MIFFGFVWFGVRGHVSLWIHAYLKIKSISQKLLTLTCGLWCLADTQEKML